MRANRFRAASQQIFLDRVVTTFDGRTRADGFHILHDWDGKALRTNPDIIPIDVLHFIAEQRGGDPSTAIEPAILLDYYFMHVIALLTMRAWDEGDPNQNFDRLNAMVAELQGPNGSGQQFAADAETMMLIGTSHYEPEEWGYARLLDKARTLDDRHQFAVGLGHAASMSIVRRFFVIAILAALFGPPSAYAQTTGSITGVVSDASGAVLPGVTVTLSGERLIGGPQTQVSDTEGTYRFDRLVPGSYNMTSCAPTKANRIRIAISRRLVTSELCGTSSLHGTRLFRYSTVAATNGTNRLLTMV